MMKYNLSILLQIIPYVNNKYNNERCGKEKALINYCLKFHNE